MGFKSALKTFNKYNPYALHRKHALDNPSNTFASGMDDAAGKDDSTSSSDGKSDISPEHEILSGHATPISPVEPGDSQPNIAESFAPQPSPNPGAAANKLGEPPDNTRINRSGLFSRTNELGAAPTFDDKDTNGAVKSGLNKGWDAFMRSGNPLAFAFGFGSGATNDKTYDERKTYKDKLSRYDEQFKRAYTQDNAEADSYFKQKAVDREARDYKLNVAKYNSELQNKQDDNSRADRSLAQSIVGAAMKRRGGILMPAERKELERIYGQPIGDTVPPEIKNELLRIEEPGGGNIYGVADINNPAAPTKTLLDPEGHPLKVAKTDPLVQVMGNETKNAELSADVDVQPLSSAEVDKKAIELARGRATNMFGDAFKKTGDAFFSTGMGAKLLEQARKDVKDDDTTRVETERKRRVLNRRKEIQAGPKGDDNNIVPSSESKKKVEALLNSIK